MGQTIPGGVYLDDRGRPQDANGDRLESLPDRLSEEEKATCREAGLITRKQVDHFSAEELADRFGIGEMLARKAKGETDLFDDAAPSAEDAEKAADEIGATDPLADVAFGSSAAEELAVKAGLTAFDFEGVDPSGQTGYTKPDVEAILEGE